MTIHDTVKQVKPLLRVEDLTVTFRDASLKLFTQKLTLRAVDSVSFEVNPGEVLGLVGESGCGKSTLARAILRLVEPTSGDIVLNGDNFSRLTSNLLRQKRRQMQMIFQDPLASLDPRMTVGDIIAEPLNVFFPHLKKHEARQQVKDMMERVGLSPTQINYYPHYFSGGQCQRIGIARALIVQPELVICDEPISALDVSIKAQIINLLVTLQKEFGLSLLFISHDLGIVKHISDRIMVMYLGKIVEIGDTETLFNQPKHPYTQALIRAIPKQEPERTGDKTNHLLTGEVPSPLNPPGGCNFHPRCPLAIPRCRIQSPRLKTIDNQPEAQVACHLVESHQA